MDRIDKKILALLQENADLPCWRRIQRLEVQGFIKRKVALLDAGKLNA